MNQPRISLYYQLNEYRENGSCWLKSARKIQLVGNCTHFLINAGLSWQNNVNQGRKQGTQSKALSNIGTGGILRLNKEKEKKKEKADKCLCTSFPSHIASVKRISKHHLPHALKSNFKKKIVIFFVTFKNFTSAREKAEIGQWYPTDGLNFASFLQEEWQIP